MIAIVIEFDVKPEARADFLDRLRADAAETLADDGCERMDLYAARGSPDRIVLVELWRDQAAIDAHRAKPGHGHGWQEPLLLAKRVTVADAL